MCIAIYKPSFTIALTDKELVLCKDNNPDGFGYAFIKSDEVIVKKYLSFDEFKYCYREDEAEYKDSPFLIHFRASSAGAINTENCHPFSVSKKQAFIHNGTLFSVPIAEKKSDTNLFNENILKDLPKNWTTNNGIVNLVKAYVSPGKIVVLNADGTYLICGESFGHWRDGIWFSNNDYKTNRRITYPIMDYEYYQGKYTNKTTVQLSLDKFTCQNCFQVFSRSVLDSMPWGDKEYDLCPHCKKEWESFT